MKQIKCCTFVPSIVFKIVTSETIDLQKYLGITALLVALISTDGYAQKRAGFESFIHSVSSASIAKRSHLINEYLVKAETTPIIEGNEKAHLIWFGKADTLKVEGELQTSWAIPEVMTRIDCGEKDLFYITYTLPGDAVLEYRFIADGNPILDEKNPRIAQGFDFSDRNFFTMPDFVASPYLKVRYGIPKGVINQWLFKTQHSPFTNLPIWIYTPFGYSKDNIYPVLYVFDGPPMVYARPFLNVVNNLIYDKKIEPIVIVFLGVEDRWTEYVSESPEYAKLVTGELVPFIEKHFQVSTTPDKRAIIGASASGHGAFVTALRHPDVFGNIASQGGGGGGYPGLNPIANAALDDYLTKKGKTPLRKIYTEVGTYDLEFPDQKIIFADGVDQFNKRLTENKIDFVFAKVNGGHNATVWDQNLDRILMLFFGR